MKKFLTVVCAGACCLLAGSSVFAAPATKSKVDVIGFDSGNPIDPGVAVSKLVRTSHGVSMTIKTNTLEPGTYTNWFVIFNDPTKCLNDPCVPPADLFVDGVDGSLVFATGNVVGASGKGGFAAHLSEGDIRGALFGPGLLDARVAEVRLTVRYHGPVIPALMPAQINSFGGGCSVFKCDDVQTAIHQPQP